MAMSLRSTYPAYLAGEAFQPNHDLEVINPYTGHPIARVPLADADVIEQAIAAAAGAAGAMRRMHPYERSAVLQRCVEALQGRREELAWACCLESGKPITAAEAEVQRAIDTFRIAEHEALAFGGGEVIPLAISPRAAGYRGMTQRIAVGPCSFITPFNFPLNLVAHKIAPAIAAGCPFVLKPADKTPISALLLGEILADCQLPPGAWSILPAKVDDATALVEDDRLRLLSFTGSDTVGWDLKARAGRKKVVLELGGNAACIVDETMADGLDHVADRLIFGAYAQAGQSCISVQRIVVHDEIYEPLKRGLMERIGRLVHGDPQRRETFVGPMIRPEAAAGLRRRMDEALSRGTSCLVGGDVGGPNQTLMQSALFEDVPRDAGLYREEAFGPVALLSRFERFEEALAEVNDSRFGLQAGLFTRDLHRTHAAWDALEVGGIIVNDIPGWRVDHMPYGGVKESGLGREGVRYAMDDMTEVRLMVVREEERSAEG